MVRPWQQQLLSGGTRSNTDNTGKVTPVLGSVDAETNMFGGSVPTSTTAHSVAASLLNRHVFLPIASSARLAGWNGSDQSMPDAWLHGGLCASGLGANAVAHRLDHFMKDASR